MLEIFRNIDLINVIFYVFIGFVPGVIWLLLYLKEDEHPESSKMIFSVFLWGMMAAPFAVAIEYLFLYGFDLSTTSENWRNALCAFIGIAFIEEWLKYRVVLEHAERNPAFDEPVDAMIYLIIAALGFATIENILYIIPEISENLFSGLGLTIYRFAGATFLHTLASAIVGYFLALNFFYKKSKIFLYAGVIIATALHTLYNYFLSETGNIGILLLLLAAMATIVLKMFHNLKMSEIEMPISK